MAAVPSIGRATAVTPRPASRGAEITHDLYERHARQIFNFCLHRLGNREEAEDATQSTFLNAFRGLERGVEPEFESAWLFKIAENVCLTRQRSSFRRRRVESPGDLDALQDLLPSPQREADELIRLTDALHGMPEQQRRALLLREWQGLSYKEIAEELDLTQAAVETLLFRARRSLAQGLTDEKETKQRGLRSRLRTGSDMGSIAALVKTLFFSGGAKIAATVATVAATSVVAATPAVRHDLVQAISPPAQHHHSAPAAHVENSMRPSSTAPAANLPAAGSANDAGVGTPAGTRASTSMNRRVAARVAHVPAAPSARHKPAPAQPTARATPPAETPAAAPAPAPEPAATEPATVAPTPLAVVAPHTPPSVPPGQAKKDDSSSTPPGQAKKHDDPAPAPQASPTPAQPASVPPGQAKKDDSKHGDSSSTPPGQAKKQADQPPVPAPAPAPTPQIATTVTASTPATPLGPPQHDDSAPSTPPGQAKKIDDPAPAPASAPAPVAATTVAPAPQDNAHDNGNGNSGKKK